MGRRKDARTSKMNRKSLLIRKIKMVARGGVEPRAIKYPCYQALTLIIKSMCPKLHHIIRHNIAFYGASQDTCSFGNNPIGIMVKKTACLKRSFQAGFLVSQA